MFKKTIFMFLCLFFSFMLISIPFTQNVIGIPANWIELDDFDDYSIGDYWGSTANYDWERINGSGTYFKIAGDPNPGGNKYLEVQYGTDDSDGWFNNTGYYFGFYFRVTWQGSDVDIIFINQTNDWVCHLLFDYIGSPNKILAYDTTNISYNANELESVTTGFNGYISVQYYTSNILQYKIYDSNLNLLHIINETGLVAGTQTKEFFNISDIKIMSSSNAASAYFRIYEYGYISEDLEAEESCPDIDGIIIRQNDNLGIDNVQLGSLIQYQINFIGDYNAGCDIYILDNNDHLKYKKFIDKIGDLPTPYEISFNVFFYNTWSAGVYNFQVIEAVPYECQPKPDYFESDNSFTVYNNTVVLNITDEYGITDPYAEWNYIQYPEQKVGEYFKFFYFLPKNDSASTTAEDYYYAITIEKLLAGGGATTQYNNVLRIGRGGLNQVVIDDYSLGKIGEKGTYWLYVWNMSTSVNRTTDFYWNYPLEYFSQPLYVTEYSDDWVTQDDVDTGIGVIIPNLRGTMYGGLVGVIIVGICMIIPMRIQKGLHMKQKLPSFVYVFMGALGIVIATILPFFDVWVLAFLIIVSFIYIGARYLLKSGSVEAEE